MNSANLNMDVPNFERRDQRAVDAPALLKQRLSLPKQTVFVLNRALIFSRAAVIFLDLD
jgi:hypothetical protein